MVPIATISGGRRQLLPGVIVQIGFTGIGGAASLCARGWAGKGAKLPTLLRHCLCSHFRQWKIDSAGKVRDLPLRDSLAQLGGFCAGGL